MLENAIEKLTTAIERLTAAIEAQPLSAQLSLPLEQPSSAPAAPATPAAQAVTHDDLQALCLSIVRADRSKRDAVKAAVASFGGAAVLADVPAGDLPALKVMIEKLQ